MRGPQAVRTLLRGSNVTDPSLTVDLTNVDIAGASAAAFRAKSNNPAPVRLWDSGVLATPADYWDRIEVDSTERLRIEKGRFYILRSFEQMSLPGSVAVYCRAIDETIGEIRIHYAGFVHPFFGHDREDHAPGTPLIFEVRGHSIDVNLKHRERMARLVFYRMSEAAERNEAPESPYESQTLKLSKLFTAWD
jgi:dCTP deaminase